MHLDIKGVSCIRCLLVQNVEEMTASSFTALTLHITVPITSTVSCMTERGGCSKCKMEVAPVPRFTRAPLHRIVACRLQNKVAAFSREVT
jgi:hypothetical protein